jgi:hypothetical protein
MNPLTITIRFRAECAFGTWKWTAEDHLQPLTFQLSGFEAFAFGAFPVFLFISIVAVRAFRYAGKL